MAEHFVFSEEGLALACQYDAWRAVVDTMQAHGLTEDVRSCVVNGREAQAAGLAACDVVHDFIIEQVGERLPGMDEQARELVARLMAVGLLHGQIGAER